MYKIKLNKNEWNVDENTTLGPPGGFGTVFIGYDNNGKEVAVKKIKDNRSNSASREIRIAKEFINSDFQNIMNIFDYGIDSINGGNYIVMEKAEYDLFQFINECGSLDQDNAIVIINNILNGLSEAKELVHRDLKPRNILFISGNWKITDFGIAKFINESTSINTLKAFLSIQYASPEQCKLQTATKKSDIYSLGCIAYYILTGNPPFQGDFDEIKEQHISASPINLEIINQSLSSLLLMMLRKPPNTRPEINRIKNILSDIQSDNLSNNKINLDSLKEAGSIIEKERSEREAESNRLNEIRNKRLENAIVGIEILDKLIDDLLIDLQKLAPNAKITKPTCIQRYTGNLPAFHASISLGQAILFVKSPINLIPYEKDFFKSSNWDILIASEISLNQNPPNEYIWSANLLFGKREDSSSYRWYEVPFMHNPALYQSEPAFEPFYLDDEKDIRIGLGNSLYKYQLASNPKKIDDEDYPSFLDRWGKILALASRGILRRPSRLPFE